MRNFISVEPDLHIVVTIAQHACDRVLKGVLKLSTYQLEIYLVKYECLRSLQLCDDQGICGKLKSKHVLADLYDLSGDQAGFKFDSCSENVKQGGYQRF